MTGKKKIVIANEGEVAEYGGAEGDPPAQASGADESPAEAAAQAPAAAEPVERSEADEWREKYLRAKAELANYQRRAQKERAEAIRYAHAELVRALLPMLDDLERVIASGEGESAALRAVVDGAKLTRENVHKVLGQFDVVPIEAAGQPFDPAVHEAMMEQPSAEHAERMVLRVLSKGYRLHDRVLRPAKVIVSKPAPPADAGPRPAGQAGGIEES